MWFTVVRKCCLHTPSYAVKSCLAHQLKSCVQPCVSETALNCAASPNYSKASLSRTLSTKSKLVENLKEESQNAKKRGPKSARRKDVIPNDVLQYFILNGMETVLDRIPKRLLNVKRKPPEVRYIFNKNVASAVVDEMKDHLLQNESPILEANPGLGFVTKKLLDLPISRIHLYEPSHDFRLHLNDLVEANPGRVSMADFNFFNNMTKIVFQDKMDNGTRLHTLLQDLPRREWTAAEPAMRIVGVLPSLGFVKHLMLSLTSQSGLITYGRPELFVLMEPLLYTHLTCDGKAGYMLYRTTSVMFQLIFHYEILTKVPRKAVFPWHTGPSQKKFAKLCRVDNVDEEWMYLVKCVPSRDFYNSVVASDQLLPLWYFVRHHMISRNNRIIPQLERWVPGCGPRVIAKGMNIFSKFGDLSPQELLTMFHEFTSWPEYSTCPFLPSVEYAYMKMESGSDELDDTPTRRERVGQVERELTHR